MNKDNIEKIFFEENGGVFVLYKTRWPTFKSKATAICKITC